MLTGPVAWEAIVNAVNFYDEVEGFQQTIAVMESIRRTVVRPWSMNMSCFVLKIFAIVKAFLLKFEVNSGVFYSILIHG